MPVRMIVSFDSRSGRRLSFDQKFSFGDFQLFGCDPAFSFDQGQTSRFCRRRIQNKSRSSRAKIDLIAGVRQVFQIVFVLQRSAFLQIDGFGVGGGQQTGDVLARDIIFVQFDEHHSENQLNDDQPRQPGHQQHSRQFFQRRKAINRDDRQQT